jgi:hypothetical protein
MPLDELHKDSPAFAKDSPAFAAIAGAWAQAMLQDHTPDTPGEGSNRISEAMWSSSRAPTSPAVLAVIDAAIETYNDKMGATHGRVEDCEIRYGCLESMSNHTALQPPPPLVNKLGTHVSANSLQQEVTWLVWLACMAAGTILLCKQTAPSIGPTDIGGQF